MNKLILALPVAMALAFPAAASAQQQEGLINVTVSADNTDVLNELQLSAPINVQVPIGIAANVCGIDANLLAQQKQEDENVTCEAQNSTQAFANLVSRQVN